MKITIFYPRYGKAIFGSFLLTTSLFASNFDPAALSEQSRQFWQDQEQPLESSSPTPRIFGRMRSGYALTEFQKEEIERASYRHAFSEMLRKELPRGLQEKHQRLLRSLEEEISEGGKRALPSLVCQKVPASLINACNFQLSDTFEQSSKKIARLGIKVINTPLVLTQAEKNNLAALCFMAAAYKSLKMEEDVQEPYRCDFYGSVSELFMWSAHRYQSVLAKRYALDKASSNLEKALQSLSLLPDSDSKKDWEMKISQLEEGIKKRYEMLKD